jgi:hypothetical protein
VELGVGVGVAWAVGGAEQERIAWEEYGGVRFVDGELRGRQSCRKLEFRLRV